MMNKMQKDYEVIILGSGISGSLLATVLAKNNVKVCIVDNGQHPRFSIGESTVPETTANLKMMSYLYDIPEIAKFSNFLELNDHVGSSHGVKKGFSFCYHEENKPHMKEQCTQTATLSPPLGPDAHWYRQDTDQYMLSVAISYGVDVFQNTQVEDVDVTDDAVTMTTSKMVLTGEFLVDGSGPFSPAVQKMKIRDDAPNLATHSRGFFTHMVGVGRWEDILPKKEHKMPYSMDQTTLHHIFDGGWMWVIPFDNHRNATNNLASVGVVLDMKKWPDEGLPADEEFNRIINLFPDIKRQFIAAKPVRNWVSSKCLQYSSSQHYVKRYFAMPQVATFIDPLFSSGLVLVTHVINVLGKILIDSFKSQELQVEKLKMLESQIIHKNSIYDILVSTSYQSFKRFDLWNAWHRVWEIGTYFNTLAGMRCILKYEETGDKEYLWARYKMPYGKPLAFAIEGYDVLFDQMVAAVTGIEKGEHTIDDAIEKIYASLHQFKAMPYFITRRESAIRTSGDFTIMRLAHIFIWAKLYGPKSTQHYYDFGMLGYMKLSAAYVLRYWFRGVGRPLTSVALMFYSGVKKLKSKMMPRVPPFSAKSRMLAMPVAVSIPMDKSLGIKESMVLTPDKMAQKNSYVLDAEGM